MTTTPIRYDEIVKGDRLFIRPSSMKQQIEVTVADVRMLKSVDPRSVREITIDCGDSYYGWPDRTLLKII